MVSQAEKETYIVYEVIRNRPKDRKEIAKQIQLLIVSKSSEIEDRPEQKRQKKSKRKAGKKLAKKRFFTILILTVRRWTRAHGSTEAGLKAEG